MPVRIQRERTSGRASWRSVRCHFHGCRPELFGTSISQPTQAERRCRRACGKARIQERLPSSRCTDKPSTGDPRLNPSCARNPRRWSRGYVASTSLLQRSCCCLDLPTQIAGLVPGLSLIASTPSTSNTAALPSLCIVSPPFASVAADPEVSHTNERATSIVQVV